MNTLTTPSIRREFIGGREDISLMQFCAEVVQDDDTGIEVAERLMLLGAEDGIWWNTEDYHYVERFSVVNASALQLQLKEATE